MTSVRLENVTKRFGNTVALDAINLSIDKGELFFLLGPSGCGKSTLLRLIAGLHGPSEGKIFFDNRDVTGVGTEQRNAVMCFQSYALWPHMTVRENIRFGLETRKVPRAEADRRVDEVIALVQLDQFAHRKPNELSGGQQQRVALARALVVKPDCLLLDEPLSNLDAKLRLEMRSEIRRICRASGLTAVYVTHDQKEALSIADRMAVLNSGRIEQTGRPFDLYLRPKNRFVANFMGETNFLPGRLVSRERQRASVQTTLGVIESTAIVEAVGDAGDVVVSIRPEAVRVGTSEHDVNSFPATLHDTMYLGEIAQHAVTIKTTGSPIELRAFEMNPRFVARDGETQAAHIYFDPADAVVLPAEKQIADQHR